MAPDNISTIQREVRYNTTRLKQYFGYCYPGDEILLRFAGPPVSVSVAASPSLGLSAWLSFVAGEGAEGFFFFTMTPFKAFLGPFLVDVL